MNVDYGIGNFFAEIQVDALMCWQIEQLKRLADSLTNICEQLLKGIHKMLLQNVQPSTSESISQFFQVAL
jgi:hypothetical protein